LIDVCPASHIAAAIEVLLAEPTLLEASERISWARKHLINAGSDAERLVAIIKTAQASS
jgi:hypothetical protein